MKTTPFLRALALVLTLTAMALHAQVPQILNYQGRVAVGIPAVNFDGTGAFKFALVQGEGPTLLWKNDGSMGDTEPTVAVSLTVTKGLYSVLLGDTTLGVSMTAIPHNVFANSDVRLRVWFNDGTNGSQLLTPDQRLASVGHAIMAGSLQPGTDIVANSLDANSSIHVGTQSVDGSPKLIKFGDGSYVSIGENTSDDRMELTAKEFHFKTNIGSSGVIYGNGSGLTNIPASAVVTPPPGMVIIPAGTFTMGNSVAADTNITNAAPVSTTVSAFYMDVNEVTLSKWQSVYYWAKDNGYTDLPAGSGKGANHPVQTVSWHDVVKWCNARSEQAGKTPVYYTNDAQTAIYKTGNVDVTNAQAKWTANGYRLPTEAEWEKAARGGLSGQRFPWGNKISQNLANYIGYTALFSYDQGPDGYNAIGSIGGTSPATSPVGSFAANGYGLYDMAGNVFEWCWDYYPDGSTPHAGGTDPHGAATGIGRVLRGGSWMENATNARCAERGGNYVSYAFSNVGFRAVLSPAN